jgi:purine-nucleoside/S-methyl-5'-thioadenosine phosphorylase / adenosine deaminase
MIQSDNNSTCYLTFESFDGLDDVVAFVTTRHGGESTGPYATMNLGRRGDDDPAVVMRNRGRMATLAGVSAERLTFARQIHGARVAVVGAADAGRAIDDTDALVTDVSGAPLVILTADCAAVFLLDPVRRAVGIAHAGWRGTVARIAARTVETMQSAFGTDPRDLVAGIGPSIGPCCYEVGQDVVDAVYESLADHADQIVVEPDMASAGSFRGSVNEDRKHFDLWIANERILMDAGVAPERIEIAGLCTACRTDLFYSHRAEHGRTGRFGGLIMLP